MKAIGGYFGLECGDTPLYYPDGIYLNSCRNALKYLVRSLGIKRIHMPFFTCHVVFDAIKEEGCEVFKYHIDRNLYPVKEFPRDDFIVYNNYFGLNGANVTELSSIYPNLIVDNAQAFYSQPECRATVYSPRKFFGLPDGGILRGKDIPFLELERGTSYEVCGHLLKRIDFGAEAGFADFIMDDEALDRYPLEKMSKLTKALTGNIDYNGTKEKRLSNFNYLAAKLPIPFLGSMDEEDVPMIFPMLVENGLEIKQKLIREKIFCATYWPNVLEWCNSNTLEYELAKNLIPLPIDQRYGLEEMNQIINILK